MSAQNPGSPKGRGLPLWTAMVALFVIAALAAVALGALYYYARSDKEKVNRELEKERVRAAQNELNAKKAAEEAKLAMARTRQEEVLAQARLATNTLGLLVQELKQVSADATDLKTSEAGRTVALHPDLVAQARRLYDTDLPGLVQSAEVITRLEGVRRIEQQLVTALGTTYQPEAELAVTAQNAAVWADQERRRVKNAQTLLAGLVQESKIKVAATPLTAQSPTLEAAIAQLRQDESTQHQRTTVERTTQAQNDAAKTQADAEARRIKMESDLYASNVLAKVDAEKAQWEMERKLKEAEQKRKETENRMEVIRQQEEARRIELRKKASDPEVQNKLAPFITPGYWQTKVGGVSVDKLPLSFSQLQTRGALAPTDQGMRALVEVASSPQDRVRPRWKLSAGWMKKPDQHEKVKEAQSLLIELGPVLVEMNMLQP